MTVTKNTEMLLHFFNCENKLEEIAHHIPSNIRDI